ncbi:DUF6527 family protein [Burkholderia glumae]|uniref:DUF6527 family protein n=1 Tax=Burkholderia glumae TaxID=337 RepID=UPI0020CF713A|nr:DUF6527 family protein [Burkholderia glumae]MCQ0032574.1 DUF6527 family protein [Burkholderia glumae]MCQ0035788.1 DUF6527 family protein [Burkholderia glumae]
MPKLHRTALGSLLFECPCGDLHVIYPVGCAAQHPARWQWNGSLDAPTFTPSLRVAYDLPGGAECVCHSFITDGRIQFCADSTHPLAGQTVDIPEWEG